MTRRSDLAVRTLVLLARSGTRLKGSEVAEHIGAGSCPRPRDLPIPKLVDLRDGTAVYDERQEHKLPDWTYAK